MADTNGVLDSTWGLPVGTIVTYAKNAVPSGFLACNGASLLRATYSRLFTVIGTSFGAEDSTHFALPDLRGLFVRMVGGQSAAFGVMQQDAIQNILGSFTLRNSTSAVLGSIVNGTEGAFYQSDGTWTANTLSISTGDSQGKNVKFDASRSVATAAENRPVNMALMFAIKY